MRLSDCFMEIIAYASFVARKGAATSLPYDKVRTNMQRLIAQSEALLDKGNFTKDDFNLARFAVFAWVDEVILSSQWEGRLQWQREQLQRQYFQTADAGELFFERLNTIGPHQMDVREVFFLCLALGFTGQFCNEGDEFLLEQLRSSNLKLLTGSSMGLPNIDNMALFPEAYPQGETGSLQPAPQKMRWSPFTIACACAPVVLFGLLLVVYKFILGNIGSNLIGTVQ